MIALITTDKFLALILSLGLPVLISVFFIRSDQRHRGEMRKVYLTAAITSLAAWFAALAWLVWPRR
jgi:hypothetical protein